MPDVFISDPKKEETSAPPIANEDLKSDAARFGLPEHSSRVLSAFSFYPNHVDFESREKEEKVILLLRQHPIVNLKWIVIVVLMIFAPSVVAYLNVLSTLPAGLSLVITLSWYLFTMAYALENFLDWYFNVYFVTNRRIVDIDFYNLIDKKVSDAEIDRIQDVNYTTFGVPRMLFNFGDVFIQTASEVSEFDFLAVPNPEKVVKILDDLMPKDKKEV